MNMNIDEPKEAYRRTAVIGGAMMSTLEAANASRALIR